MPIDYGRFSRQQNNTQAEQLQRSMMKTSGIIGATEVEVLQPNGVIKKGIINTLNKKELLSTTATNFRYFFTVPPLVLASGDIVLDWEGYDWIIINAQNTGEIVYQGYSCKCVDIYFDDGATTLKGAFSHATMSADGKKILELSDGNINLFMPNNEDTVHRVVQNTVFSIDGFSYEIYTRPDRISADGLITVKCRDYAGTDDPVPVPPTEDNYIDMGWAKTLTSTIPTKWAINTSLKHVVEEETLHTLVFTVPIQKLPANPTMTVVNSEQTYTLKVR